MAAYKDAENDNSEAKNDFQETQSDQKDECCTEWHQWDTELLQRHTKWINW